MTRKVFGVGWAKTGTTTLGRCFEILGLRHVGPRLGLVDHLADDDLEPVLDVARRHDAFEDWPWLLLYGELDQAFPGSRFVLTCRDDDAWLASYRAMLETQGEAPPDLTRRRRILYGLPFPDVGDEQLLDRRRRHERNVRSYFAKRPADLLEVNWANGDGWSELCAFLPHPIPDVPFPHENRGNSRARRLNS